MGSTHGRTSNICTGLLTVAACSLLSAWSGGHQFRSSANLVVVDVVIAGGDAAQRGPLSATDFAIFEDDVQRPVQTFQFIDTRSSIAAATPGVFKNDGESGAIFTLVVDELALEPQDMLSVRRLGKHFVEQALTPDDQVAVLGSGTASPFVLSRDRKKTVQTLDRFRGLRRPKLGIEQDSSALQSARPETAQPGLEFLISIIEKVEPIAGRRKVLLWFTTGPIVPADAEPGDFDVLSNHIRRLLDRARSANVAIYSVDPRGLQVAAGVPQELSPAVEFDTLGALRDVASATGGFALVNGNDLNAALSSIVRENHSYYLLGYEPAATGTGPKKIRVQSTVPGLTLRHRMWFVPPSSMRASTGPAQSPVPISNLSVSIAPALVFGAQGRPGLIIAYALGGSLPDGAPVSYTLVATDADGKVVGELSGQTIARAGSATGTLRVSASDKTSHVRLMATSLSATGVASAPIQTPDPNHAGVRCGGFVLEQPGAEVFRHFTNSRPLRATVAVFARAVKQGSLSLAIAAPGEPPSQRWQVSAVQPIGDGIWQLALDLMPPLPQGQLDLILLEGTRTVDDSCISRFVLG